MPPPGHNTHFYMPPHTHISSNHPTLPTMMPSNWAMMKLRAGSCTASAKVCSLTTRSPSVTESWDKKPVRAPDPYWMAKSRPSSYVYGTGRHQRYSIESVPNDGRKLVC